MITNILKPKIIANLIPKASMSAQSKKDFEAIQTYNRLRKKPMADTSYHHSELRMANAYFEKIKEYRKKSEEGFEPSKLLMVWRIAPLLNRPIWEKELIIELGLADHKVKFAIVMNTASSNKKLWSIKHLIRVKPITYPDGFPTEDDYMGTFLKQTGELVVAPRLRVDPKVFEKDPEYERKKLDPRTIREHLRLLWQKGYPKMY